MCGVVWYVDGGWCHCDYHFTPTVRVYVNKWTFLYCLRASAPVHQMPSRGEHVRRKKKIICLRNNMVTPVGVWYLVDFIFQFVSDFFPNFHFDAIRSRSTLNEDDRECVCMLERVVAAIWIGAEGLRKTEKQSKPRIRASLEWEHQTMVRIHCHRSGFGNRPSKSNDSSIFFSSSPPSFVFVFFPKNFNTQNTQNAFVF